MIMAVTKPRNRLVNFRVSEDEFNSLREACESGGARSISDFARCAVLSPTSSRPESEEVLRLRLALIEEKMGEVDAKLLLIARMLRENSAPAMMQASASQYS
jgi:hypothetical protein